jgi:uncharacterized protein (TIRG00374 family)
VSRGEEQAAQSRQERRFALADRLEREIEERVDVERELELERSQAEASDATSGPGLKRTIFWLSITGISLYLVAPSLLDVLSSWKNLEDIDWWWFPAMAVLQTASLACLWLVQRAALREAEMPNVIETQLAGNALAKIAPGGGALGGALQYRMLVEAGLPRGPTAAGITASNLLIFVVVLALPVLVLPALLGGAVNRDLLAATIIGAIAFAVLAGLGVILLAYDEPLACLGRAVQAVRNRLRRSSEPLRTLPQRLVRERDRLLATLGPSWRMAMLATVGRWAFDYATLLAALAAVGSTPRPALVLLAFCAAQVLAQVPVTPGGLGFVEAGLTAMLALAGVSAASAVLATFAYRLFNYWLQLPAGLVGYLLHRRRFTAGPAAPV